MIISVSVTGLDKLLKGCSSAPGIVKDELGRAIGDSLYMIEGEARKRTPVDTGTLKKSIGNPQKGGWRWIRGLQGSVGTYVDYAFFVETREARHKVGQSHFMEAGANAAKPTVIKFFEAAMKRIAAKVAKPEL